MSTKVLDLYKAIQASTEEERFSDERRGKLHTEALESLVSEGCDPVSAKQVIKLIVQNKIQHIRFNY